MPDYNMYLQLSYVMPKCVLLDVFGMKTFFLIKNVIICILQNIFAPVPKWRLTNQLLDFNYIEK